MVSIELVNTYNAEMTSIILGYCDERVFDSNKGMDDLMSVVKLGKIYSYKWEDHAAITHRGIWVDILSTIKKPAHCTRR